MAMSMPITPAKPLIARILISSSLKYKTMIFYYPYNNCIFLIIYIFTCSNGVFRHNITAST